MEKSSNDNHHKSINLIMLANDYGFIKKLFWSVFVVLVSRLHYKSFLHVHTFSVFLISSYY